MMVVLLVAGIGLLLGGLLTVGLGIQLDLSFGNTLIQAGAVVACTGVMMLGFWIAVRELVRQLGPGLPAEARARSTASPAGFGAAPGGQPPQDGGFPFDRDQPGAEHDGHAEPAPLPWREEAGRGEVPAPAPAEAAPAAKARRNLLFSSTSRKERERAQARTGDSSATEPQPAGLAVPPPIARPVAESGEAPPASFDDAWPKPERSRTTEAPLPRRDGRTPSTFSESGADAAAAVRLPPGARNEEPPPVTVLKSGVVDGMAYSLYSDGSIEAQMPEGMMRFASIDELRAHLDHRP